ncbi:hypothetical protein HYV10_00345 [Candidatus Dependentiae bacterium]|nr:hypothetical protein [Candidatus Dependentiae bacterium]
MKLMQKINLGIILFLFGKVFAALPLATKEQLNQGKALKNNILNSVQSNTSKATSLPTFIPASTAKTTVSMPVVSDLPVQSEAVDNLSKPKSIMYAASPKDSAITVTDALPKLNMNTVFRDSPVVQQNNRSIDKNIIEKTATVLSQEEKKEEPSVLYQNEQMVQDPAMISFNFEDASLTNLLSYIESVFGVKFITDDIIVGAKDAKGAPVPVNSVAGHKINFRTNKNLTFKEAWDLFITFMNISGFNIVPMTSDRFYRVVPLAKSSHEAIPTYIGLNHDVLPDSEMIVRYVYFAKNIMDLSKLQIFLKNFQSGSAKLDVYSDLRALIFTDRSSSIKSLMQIVNEFDKGMTPEVVSVIKLKRANVDDVVKLYEALKPQNPAGIQQGAIKIWSLPSKESTLDYFSADVNLVGDKRTNSLVVLGAVRDVKRVEDFITKYIDIEIEKNAPPVFTYKLQYTNAQDITNLVNQVIKYGATTDVGKYGGVRDGIKYFQQMNIVADPYTNSLMINATKEDFEVIKSLLEELDVPQKQVGIEVLMVLIKDSDVKSLGSQISGPNGAGSTVPGANLFGPTFAQSMTAQTSGIPSGSTAVVGQNTSGTGDDFSLKQSLAQLLGNPSVNEVGSVLLTFGRPIWAVFKVLKTITSTHIISNPFIVVSNNMKGTISSGEQRRQISSEIVASGGTQVKGLIAVDAKLTLDITPQINNANMVNLIIDFKNETFTQPASVSNSDGEQSPRDLKHIITKVTVANGETLVLGGIMTEGFSSSSNGVPFLSSIPIFGWFFKSKTRTVSRNHFMIFICPRLLDPIHDDDQVDKYTQYKLQEVKQHLDLIDESDWFAVQKDPIQRAFFGSEASNLQQLYTSDTYLRNQKLDGKIDNPQVTTRKKRAKKSKSKKNLSNEGFVIQPGVTNSQNLDNRLKNSIVSSVAQGDVV